MTSISTSRSVRWTRPWTVADRARCSSAVPCSSPRDGATGESLALGVAGARRSSSCRWLRRRVSSAFRCRYLVRLDLGRRASARSRDRARTAMRVVQARDVRSLRAIGAVATVLLVALIVGYDRLATSADRPVALAVRHRRPPHAAGRRRGARCARHRCSSLESDTFSSGLTAGRCADAVSCHAGIPAGFDPKCDVGRRSDSTARRPPRGGNACSSSSATYASMRGAATPATAISQLRHPFAHDRHAADADRVPRRRYARLRGRTDRGFG